VLAVSDIKNNSSKGKTNQILNQGRNTQPTPLGVDNPGKDSNRKPYELSAAYYTEQGLKISYPQITRFKDLDRQKEINQLIKNEALKVRNFYPADHDELTIGINYETKRQDENLLSIQYSGIGYLKGGPYPNNLYYTTNIDLRQGSKLHFNDLFDINEGLVQKFKSGGLIALRPDHQEILNAINNQELMERLNKADSLEHPEASDTFSYLTENSLGLSFSVAHALGDHAEFEIKYQEIKNNLKFEAILEGPQKP
jgi:hypothetical protein